MAVRFSFSRGPGFRPVVRRVQWIGGGGGGGGGVGESGEDSGELGVIGEGGVAG